MTCTSDCPKVTPAQAHCASAETLLFPLAVRDSDPFSTASFDVCAADRAPDSSGISSKAFTYLRGTEAGLVQPDGFRYPRRAVNLVMFPRSNGDEVLFTVVSSVPVVVVNVIFSRNSITKDPMFVGLDIGAKSDLPPEANVSVPRSVASGHTVRYLLTGKKLTNTASVLSTFTAGGTVPLLGCPGDLDAAGSTGLSHGAILQVKALCHRTFGGVRGFDRHRRNGRCLDPGQFGYVERDGIWREPMDHQKVATFRARVAGKEGRRRNAQ